MKRQVSPSDKPLLKRLKTSVLAAPERQVRKVGEFHVGPEIKGNTAGPLTCIKTYLAKKNEDFYKLKVLTVDSPDIAKQTKEVIQGKMLIHNEYVLLENLKGVAGVERCHGMLIDYFQDDKSKSPSKTKNLCKRITLVLDPVSDRGCENWMNINQINFNISLQEYISRHKTAEKEALLIFYEIVKVVEAIHSVGVVHRDIKLQNFLINLQTRRVTLTNFCLGRLLSSDDQMLLDQRGAPGYISADILNGAYKGKPTDIWTLGVILYILIYSTFPFVENTTAALFKKICQCELVLPNDIRVSEPTKKLIKNHLLTTSADRFTATETREYLERQFERINRATVISTASLQKDDQVVPDMSNNQPAKLICQDSPKFELSTENISMMLKMMSPTTQQEQNKMFLKPSLLAERCNRISVSPSNSPSGNSVGVTRNLTRQINNLSVRNRQHTSPGLSWHNRISNSSLYEVRFRAAESTIMTDRARMQQRSTSGPTSSFEAIYNTLNELFSNGSFPHNAIVHEFQGNINQDIALKLSIWLRTNFNDNALVREIYQSVHSPGNDVEKFVEFLRRCHVEMEMISGQVFVKAQQSNQILIFMTYLLQLAGYNNNYFLNISRGS